MRGGPAAVMIVACIGIAGMMLGASGFSQAWGAEPPRTSAAQEQVNGSASDVGPRPDNAPVSGPVSSGDSSIVGLIASGLGSIVDIAGAVALLPVTLINMGFPAWFSVPAGVFAQMVVGISVIEWATNRDW